jgi:hypothetical protein
VAQAPTEQDGWTRCYEALGPSVRRLGRVCFSNAGTRFSRTPRLLAISGSPGSCHPRGAAAVPCSAAKTPRPASAVAGARVLPAALRRFVPEEADHVVRGRLSEVMGRRRSPQRLALITRFPGGIRHTRLVIGAWKPLAQRCPPAPPAAPPGLSARLPRRARSPSPGSGGRPGLLWDNGVGGGGRAGGRTGSFPTPMSS